MSIPESLKGNPVVLRLAEDVVFPESNYTRSVNVRAYNVLHNNGIYYVGQMLAIRANEPKTKLFFNGNRLEKAGHETYKEFRILLASLGLDLEMVDAKDLGNCNSSNREEILAALKWAYGFPGAVEPSREKIVVRAPGQNGIEIRNSHLILAIPLSPAFAAYAQAMPRETLESIFENARVDALKTIGKDLQSHVTKELGPATAEIDG